MNLLIWGISNIGKITIGRELSKKLQCKFYDVDEEIFMEVQIIFKRNILMIMIDLMKKKN